MHTYPIKYPADWTRAQIVYALKLYFEFMQCPYLFALDNHGLIILASAKQLQTGQLVTGVEIGLEVGPEIDMTASAHTRHTFLAETILHDESGKIITDPKQAKEKFTAYFDATDTKITIKTVATNNPRFVTGKNTAWKFEGTLTTGRPKELAALRAKGIGEMFPYGYGLLLLGEAERKQPLPE
jgi:hypothetical protein